MTTEIKPDFGLVQAMEDGVRKLTDRVNAEINEAEELNSRGIVPLAQYHAARAHEFAIQAENEMEEIAGILQEIDPDDTYEFTRANGDTVQVALSVSFNATRSLNVHEDFEFNRVFGYGALGSVQEHVGNMAGLVSA